MACNNNLQLNRAKSTEIVFVKPRSRRLQSEPPSVISGLTRVKSIKTLRVMFSQKFYVSLHVDNLLAACCKSLFALRTTIWIASLRCSTRSVPRGSHQQVDSHICSLVGICPYRQQKSLGSISTEIFKTGLPSLTLRQLSLASVITLIANCSLELLAKLNTCCIRSSPEREHQYTQSLRKRSHKCQFPDCTSVLKDNFIMIMLYCDALYWQFYFSSRYSLCYFIKTFIKTSWILMCWSSQVWRSKVWEEIWLKCTSY